MVHLSISYRIESNYRISKVIEYRTIFGTVFGTIFGAIISKLSIRYASLSPTLQTRKHLSDIAHACLFLLIVVQTPILLYIIRWWRGPRNRKLLPSCKIGTRVFSSLLPVVSQSAFLPIDGMERCKSPRATRRSKSRDTKYCTACYRANVPYRPHRVWWEM